MTRRGCILILQLDEVVFTESMPTDHADSRLHSCCTHARATHCCCRCPHRSFGWHRHAYQSSAQHAEPAHPGRATANHGTDVSMTLRSRWSKPFASGMSLGSTPCAIRLRTSSRSSGATSFSSASSAASSGPSCAAGGPAVPPPPNAGSRARISAGVIDSTSFADKRDEMACAVPARSSTAPAVARTRQKRIATAATPSPGFAFWHRVFPLWSSVRPHRRRTVRLSTSDLTQNWEVTLRIPRWYRRRASGPPVGGHW